MNVSHSCAVTEFASIRMANLGAGRVMIDEPQRILYLTR